MRNVELIERETTEAIIGAFYEVYNRLGFGFMEHVYSLALECELTERGYHVSREAAVAIYYKGRHLTTQRLDMVVNGKVVVEIKSAENLPALARRQVRNYLRATSIEVGLVLHFGPNPTFCRVVQSIV
ncbi:MAG TPA: GxxExxY protein [Gemmatimonadaceae bacterium]